MKYLIYLFYIFIPIIGSAQSNIGLHSGLSINHMDVNINDKSYTNNVNKSGLYLGATISCSLTNNFNLKSGLEIIQKNYTLERTDQYSGIQEEYKNTYLQLPILIQYRIFEKRKTTIDFGIGAYAAYWISGRVKGTIPNLYDNSYTINENDLKTTIGLTQYSTRYKFSNEKDQRIELGPVAEISIQHYLSNKISAVFNLDYYFSLSDQQKNYTINQDNKRNRTAVISLGLSLLIPSKKDKHYEKTNK